MQELFWSATAGDDRTRDGFAVVPVTDGSFDLHYEAGTLLTVDAVGYVTGDAAPESAAGLVVLVPPDPGPAVEVPAGGSASVDVVPEELREAVLVELPDAGGLRTELDALVDETAGLNSRLTEPGQARLAQAALGLTATQAKRAFAKAIMRDDVLDIDAVVAG